MGTLESGEIVGERYRIVEPLGQGGMGTTYAAEEIETGLQVALKGLSLRSLGDWKVLELFEREARALRTIDHPGVPDYIDYITEQGGPHGDTFYLVQELVEGESLWAKIKAGWHPDEGEVRQIARQVLETLSYLHGRMPPMIHRDIKPQNLMLGPDGTVALVDFGAVKDSARQDDSFASTVVGTYGYMAPEQFRGHAEPASDLYGLGASLVYLLTQRSPDELPQKRLRVEFRAAAPSISHGFAQWLDRLLEPTPEDRLVSAAEALRALDGVDETVDAETDDVPEGPVPVGRGWDGRKKPAGSFIEEQKGADRLSLVLPTRGLSRGIGFNSVFELIFACVWTGFIGFWTFTAFVGSVFFALFSIPFWVAGIWMFYRLAQKYMGREHLTIDRETYTIERFLAGIRTSRVEGRTDEISKVRVSVPKMMQKRRVGPGSELLSCVEFEVGVNTFELGAHLAPAENEWLVERIQHQLKAPRAQGNSVLPSLGVKEVQEHAKIAEEESRY